MYYCIDSRKFVPIYPPMRRMDPPFPTLHLASALQREGVEWGGLYSPAAGPSLSFLPAGPWDSLPPAHTGHPHLPPLFVIS